jgi:hypothetical protein
LPNLRINFPPRIRRVERQVGLGQKPPTSSLECQNPLNIAIIPRKEKIKRHMTIPNLPGLFAIASIIENKKERKKTFPNLPGS